MMATHEACHMMKAREGLDDHVAQDLRAGKKCKWIYQSELPYWSLLSNSGVSEQNSLLCSDENDGLVCIE